MKQQLELALKDAMRASDDLRKRTLRMVLSAIRMAEVDNKGPLNDNAIMAILHKEIKSRQESIADAQKGNRPDLVEASQAEIAVLEGFLPKQLSAQELEDFARQAIAEAGATEPRHMGQVMKLLLPRLEGRATGEQASQMVRKLLLPGEGGQ